VQSAQVDHLLDNLRKKLEREGALKPGKHLGEEPHGSYSARFDEGSGAPVVDSSKSRFNGPVANPKLLKLGQPEAVIARLESAGALTPKQTSLLEQMRNEVKRRGKTK